MVYFKQWIMWVLCLSALVGCGDRAHERGELSLWVTILPQIFFVERIAGASVEVSVLVKPGQSPELYAPSAAQMADLARANLYFGIGVPVEAVVFPRLERAMNNLQVVSTGPIDPRIAFAGGREDHEHDHHHGHDHHAHDHSDVNLDPHVWVDPVAMVGVVGEMRDALTAANPSAAELYRANAGQLIEELEALDAELKLLFAPFAGRAFYINHPSLGRFAARYGLRQVSIEHTGSEPSPRRLAELVTQARADRIGAVFKQPEFGRSSAAVLARALELEVFEVNPLARDYFSNMRAMAHAIVGSFGG